MMKLKYWILGIIWSLVIGHWSFVYAIRPLYTEDCWVTSAGKPAIETGVLLLSYRDNTGLKEVITSLKYGLTDTLDISIDLPLMSRYAAGGNYDGLSDGTFKIKYNFYHDMEKEGACILFGTSFFTGDPNYPLANNQHDITTMLIYTKNADPFEYHLNFGYTFDDEPRGQVQNDFIIYNASVAHPLTDIVKIMGEVQYSRNTSTLDIISEMAIGFNYKYSNNLIFDMAIGWGLNENSSSTNLAFGSTVFLE